MIKYFMMTSREVADYIIEGGFKKCLSGCDKYPWTAWICRDGDILVADEISDNQFRCHRVIYNKEKSINNCGYNLIAVKGKAHTVHRLMATAFLYNDGYSDVDHIDGNKRNNAPENLRWCTRSENMRAAWEQGLITNPSKCHGQYKRSTGKFYPSDGREPVDMTPAEYVRFRKKHGLRLPRWYKEDDDKDE